MIKPISVDADLDALAAYVRYSQAAIANTIDVWKDGQVAADVDDAGNIVGIEVLAFDKRTLENARAFAANRSLAFPRDLSGLAS